MSTIRREDPTDALKFFGLPIAYGVAVLILVVAAIARSFSNEATGFPWGLIASTTIALPLVCFVALKAATARTQEAAWLVGLALATLLAASIAVCGTLADAPFENGASGSLSEPSVIEMIFFGYASLAVVLFVPAYVAARLFKSRSERRPFSIRYLLAATAVVAGIIALAQSMWRTDGGFLFFGVLVASTPCAMVAWATFLGWYWRTGAKDQPDDLMVVVLLLPLILLLAAISAGIGLFVFGGEAGILALLFAWWDRSFGKGEVASDASDSRFATSSPSDE